MKTSEMGREGFYFTEHIQSCIHAHTFKKKASNWVNLRTHGASYYCLGSKTIVIVEP